MNEGVWPEGRPAGFWIRAVALLLDFILFALVQLSLAFIGERLWVEGVERASALHTMVGLFTGAFTALYTTVLHALGGQTLGKMLLGVRVVGADGAPLTVGAALLRWLAYFASALPVGLGFVMAGLRRDKRALHDLVAGSRVERGPARVPRVDGAFGPSTP
ncbi:MAG: RDD family protein [Candidatus Rokuibacteriota bacterium]